MAGSRPAFDGDFVSFTGSGDVTAPVQGVDLVLPPSPAPNGSTSGCEAEDFAGFVPGNIALMQRGTCPYVQKAALAQEAGASALIIFNEGQPGRTAVPNNLPLGAEGIHIPGVGTSFDVGVDLNDPGTVARVKTEVLEQLGESVNVIAETPGGDPSRTVVIGAHLDSVPAGPGINDNGSGSGGILEIAEVYAAQDRTPRNKLRFMWYGAEEIGLIGSTKYVESLTQDEKDDILAMLNFDMIGSPNFARYVYDGDGTIGPEGPTGSGFIEDVFVDYFASQGLFNEPTAFDGRSDYGPFIADGIPAGGLFTGAEQPKTAAQVAAVRRHRRRPARPLLPRRLRHVRRNRRRSGRNGAGARPGGAGPDVRRRRPRRPVLLEDQGRREEHPELTDSRTNLVAAATVLRAPGGAATARAAR